MKKEHLGKELPLTEALLYGGDKDGHERRHHGSAAFVNEEVHADVNLIFRELKDDTEEEEEEEQLLMRYRQPIRRSIKRELPRLEERGRIISRSIYLYLSISIYRYLSIDHGFSCSL
jgi:hypothetical protein